MRCFCRHGPLSKSSKRVVVLRDARLGVFRVGDLDNPVKEFPIDHRVAINDTGTSSKGDFTHGFSVVFGNEGSKPDWS